VIFKRVKILEARVNALEKKARESSNHTSEDLAFKVRTRQATRVTIPKR
jgi:hypothetical protein